MTPQEADLRREVLLQSLKTEDVYMRQIAEAIPEGRLSWKPDVEKCRPVGELAIHAARAGRWFLRMVEGLPPPEETAPQAADKAELLDMIDAEQEHFRERLRDYPSESLAEPSNLGGAQFNNIEVLSWHRDHMIHHRAQVGLYLRLMGAPVPSTYGPSGDDS